MGYWRRSVDIHFGKRHMWNLTFHILLISTCELRDRPFIYMWKQNLKSHELCFFHIRCRSHRCVYSALILTPRYVKLRYVTLHCLKSYMLNTILKYVSSSEPICSRQICNTKWRLSKCVNTTNSFILYLNFIVNLLVLYIRCEFMLADS